MNYGKKSSVALYSMVLLSVIAISASTIQNEAFAQGTGMSLKVTADTGSTMIQVSGTTGLVKNEDITVKFTSPTGNLVSIAQVTPDADGKYMTTIQGSSILWKQDGRYIVAVQQGMSQIYQLSATVNIQGGTIATPTLITKSTLDTSRSTQSNVPSENKGLAINAEGIVLGSSTIPLSGITDKSDDVTIVVTAPNGNVIAVDQLTPDKFGEFSTNIQIGSKTWKQNGMYTISASQGESLAYNSEVKVDVMDGAVVPEFGVITALVLAVAIMSIIAISAKTKLGIMPKY